MLPIKDEIEKIMNKYIGQVKTSDIINSIQYDLSKCFTEYGLNDFQYDLFDDGQGFNIQPIRVIDMYVLKGIYGK